MNDFKIISFEQNSEDNSSKNVEKEKEKKEKIKIDKKKLNWKYIVFPILGVLLAGGIIAFIILNIPNPPIPVDNPTDKPTNEDPITNKVNDFHELGPIEMQTEYKINTNKNDLKRIYINQGYYEDTK